MTRPAMMPETTPDFMAPAWAACLRWAIGEAQVRADFEAATGHRWSHSATAMPMASALEAMIDSATGHDKAYVEAFIAWFNENVWGEVE